MDGGPEGGGEPEAIGRCTECGTIFPVQETDDGNLRPVGTDGTCTCGNATFEPRSGD